MCAIIFTVPPPFFMAALCEVNYVITDVFTAVCSQQLQSELIQRDSTCHTIPPEDALRNCS